MAFKKWDFDYAQLQRQSAHEMFIIYKISLWPWSRSQQVDDDESYDDVGIMNPPPPPSEGYD